MNASTDCHEIPDCPGLFVDAFRGSYLSKTRDARHTFVLTHYHSDHYGSLPSEGRYRGPALIHCTPVTASLLIKVHQVPEHLIRVHPYGQSWTILLLSSSTESSPPSNPDDQARSQGKDEAELTFYDANHCPGAALVAIQVHRRSCGGEPVFHLHTGDMRYHPRMKTFPLLEWAARQRRLDCLLLDTTYAHPKHDFDAQEVAIDTIATQVQELLLPSSAESTASSLTGATPATTPGSTLVLLSCYSIGKERVLWEASQRSHQRVYVSEKKLLKLQCLLEDGDGGGGGSDADKNLDAHVCHQLVRRCTTDPNATDLHVIPMGMAGEMWPFFQPNYWSCREYAGTLNKPYTTVVAFIPTGWAGATKWNREHAVSRQTIDGVDVQVRLVAYSEHSSHTELCEFVNFCKPRKVIPTVFADANDRRRIEARFPVDSGRAKQAFFRSSRQLSEATKKRNWSSISSSSANFVDSPEKDEPATSDTVAVPTPASRDDLELQLNGHPVIECDSSIRKRALGPPTLLVASKSVEVLRSMGFALADCQAAIEACQGSVEASIEYLLGGSLVVPNGASSVSSVATPTATSAAGSVSSSPAANVQSPTSTLPKGSKGKKVKLITSYFAKKRAAGS